MDKELKTEEIVRALGAMVCLQQATLIAHHRILVDLMMKSKADLSASDCDKIIAEDTAIWHQKVLEGIEDASPPLAALLDLRNNDNPPPV